MSKELDAALEADSDKLANALLIKLFEAEKATKPVPEGEEESVFLEAKFGSDRWQLEWKLAKLYFARNPDENKLDKSAYPGALTHYFIKDQFSDEIYAVKPGEALGAGGFGKVKECYDEAGEALAVKVIGIHKGNEEKERANVEKEANILKSISSDPVGLAHVKYKKGPKSFNPHTRKKEREKNFSGDEISEKMFIVQKKLKTPFGKKIDEILGSSLSEKEKQEQILTLFLKAAIALDKMHKKGFIHIDFKPANLMLDENEEVFLIDFDATLKLSRNGKVHYDNTEKTLGFTEKYAPPEFISLGLLTLTPKADIYCFGRSLEYVFNAARLREIKSIAFSKFGEGGNSFFNFYNQKQKDINNILGYASLKYSLTIQDFEKIVVTFVESQKKASPFPNDDVLFENFKKHLVQYLAEKKGIKKSHIVIKNADVSQDLDSRLQILQQTPLFQLIGELTAEAPEDRPTLKEAQKRIQQIISSHATIADEKIIKNLTEQDTLAKEKITELKEIVSTIKTDKEDEKHKEFSSKIENVAATLESFPKNTLKIKDANKKYEASLVLKKSNAKKRTSGRKKPVSEKYIEVKKLFSSIDFSDLSREQRATINSLKKEHPAVHRFLKIKILEDELISRINWLVNDKKYSNAHPLSKILKELKNFRKDGAPISFNQAVIQVISDTVSRKESIPKHELKKELLDSIMPLKEYLTSEAYQKLEKEATNSFETGFIKGEALRREIELSESIELERVNTAKPGSIGSAGELIVKNDAKEDKNPSEIEEKNIKSTLEKSEEKELENRAMEPSAPSLSESDSSSEALAVSPKKDDELDNDDTISEDEPDYLRKEDEESVLAKSKEGSEPVYGMEVDFEESEFESDLEEDQLEEHGTGDEDIESVLRAMGAGIQSINEVSEKAGLHRESHDKKSRTGERTFSLDKFNPFEKRKKLSELIRCLSKNDFLNLGVPLPEKGTGQYPENFTRDYIDTYKAFKKALNATDFSNLNVLEKLEIFMLRRNPHLREFLDRKISEDKLLKRATFIESKYPNSTAAQAILAELNQLRKDGETVNLKLAAVTVYSRNKDLKADIIQLCSKKIGKDVEKAIDDAERRESEASRRSLLPHTQPQKKQPKNGFLPPSLRPSKKG